MTTEQSNQLAAVYNVVKTGDWYNVVKGTFTSPSNINTSKTITLGYKPKAIHIYGTSASWHNFIIYDNAMSTTQYVVSSAYPDSAGTKVEIRNLGSNGTYMGFNLTTTGFTVTSLHLTFTNVSMYYIASK